MIKEEQINPVPKAQIRVEASRGEVQHGSKKSGSHALVRTTVIWEGY